MVRKRDTDMASHFFMSDGGHAMGAWGIRNGRRRDGFLPRLKAGVPRFGTSLSGAGTLAGICILDLKGWDEIPH